MANQILYKTITAPTQVAIGECYLDGVEVSDEMEQMIYDEADSSRSAVKMVCKMHASSYYKYENIIFPSPGLKCSSGIYAFWEKKLATVYYHYGKSNKAESDILYSNVLDSTSKQITTLPCYLVGAQVDSGTIALYDEPDSTNSATSLVTTLKMGSHKSYNGLMFSEPIKCNNGLYALTTDGKGIIYYSLG